METTVVYVGYIRSMGNKMEATIMGLGFKVLILSLGLGLLHEHI